MRHKWKQKEPDSKPWWVPKSQRLELKKEIGALHKMKKEKDNQDKPEEEPVKCCCGGLCVVVGQMPDQRYSTILPDGQISDVIKRTVVRCKQCNQTQIVMRHTT